MGSFEFNGKSKQSGNIQNGDNTFGGDQVQGDKISNIGTGAGSSGIVNTGTQMGVVSGDGNQQGQIKPCEGSSNDGHGAGAASVVCCFSTGKAAGKCDHASSGGYKLVEKQQNEKPQTLL